MKEQIIKQYAFRTELHAHTLPVSKCSEFMPKEFVEIYATTGVNAVVVTNHLTPAHVEGKTREEFTEEYVGCFREVEKYASEKGITAIFGAEIRFKQNNNDYLLYGVTEEDVGRLYDFVSEGYSIDTFYSAFHSDRVVILQAHPLRNGMEPVKRESLDGVEGFNMHPGHNSRIALATAYANKEGMLFSGGTDFHHPGHEGACLMRTKTPMKTPEDIASVLRARDFVLDIGGSILLP